MFMLVLSGCRHEMLLETEAFSYKGLKNNQKFNVGRKKRPKKK